MNGARFRFEPFGNEIDTATTLNARSAAHWSAIAAEPAAKWTTAFLLLRDKISKRTKSLSTLRQSH